MTMIERVAEGIWNASDMRHDGPWGAVQGSARQKCLSLAKAALEAMREPTEAMIVAGMDDWLARSTDRSRVVKPYQAMINKALEGE